jgi:hypothetical protein
LIRWLNHGFFVTRHMPGINSTGEHVPVPTAASALDTAVLSSVTPSQAAPHAITFVHDANGPYHSLNTWLVTTVGGAAVTIWLNGNNQPCRRTAVTFVPVAKHEQAEADTKSTKAMNRTRFMAW